MVEKNRPSSVEERRRWIEPDHPQLSVARQCDLLGLPRSTRYYRPLDESAANLALMRRIDEQYLATPFYGSRKLAILLGANGVHLRDALLQARTRKVAKHAARGRLPNGLSLSVRSDKNKASGISLTTRNARMADEVLRHLYLGFIRLHVLYHAGKEPICGAELAEELQHHGYDVGPGTLYPMLDQMVKSGFLTREHEVVGGKRRKNLNLTAAGRKLLVKAREQLKELAAEVLDDQDARALRKRK